MASKIGERINQVIDLELKPLLTEAGFEKERKFFRWTVDGRTQVINVWSHPYANHGNIGRFMVDVGVFHPEFYGYRNDEKMKGQPKIEACAFRLQLKCRSPERPEGSWWLLDENSDDAAVAAELAETVCARGLPWLEMCSDPSRARDHLESEAQALLSKRSPFFASKALLQFEIVYFGVDKARNTLNRLIELNSRGWFFKWLSLKGWLFGWPAKKEIHNYLIETGRELGLL